MLIILAIYGTVVICIKTILALSYHFWQFFQQCCYHNISSDLRAQAVDAYWKKMLGIWKSQKYNSQIRNIQGGSLVDYESWIIFLVDHFHLYVFLIYLFIGRNSNWWKHKIAYSLTSINFSFNAKTITPISVKLSKSEPKKSNPQSSINYQERHQSDAVYNNLESIGFLLKLSIRPNYANQ